MEFALDLEIDATAPFTGAYFQQEIQGMADAIPEFADGAKRIQRLMLIGELTKGQCSMFGAWGDAIPSSHHLLQMRSLDWNTDGKLSIKSLSLMLFSFLSLASKLTMYTDNYIFFNIRSFCQFPSNYCLSL